MQPNRNNESFLFTNWAGEKEYSAERPEEYSCDSQSPSIPVGKCQLSSDMPGKGVAIYGHRNREGTWFSVPTEAQKCDATREHSICGNYVVFEEPEGENRSNLPIRSRLMWAGSENSAKAPAQLADKSL